MLGAITSHIIEQNNITKEKVMGMLAGAYLKMEAFFNSKLFYNILAKIQPTESITRLHNESALLRIFLKKRCDLSRDSQIDYEEICTNLQLDFKEIVVQDQIKWRENTHNRRINHYNDVDFQLAHAIMEVLFHIRYNKHNIQYLILGSSDKDFHGIIQMAKKLGLIVILVCFIGDFLSIEMENAADMVIILYPRLVVRKPFYQDLLNEYIDRL